MAAPKNHHRYLIPAGWPTKAALSTANFEEFDEADVWSSNDDTNTQQPKTKLKYSAHRPMWKPDRPSLGPKSVPVNVPDWSKILQQEYRSHGGEYTEEEDDDEEEEEDENERMPPHEYLARRKTASFSVHEGNGRTLKGRDMSRVRNAIWKQIGLID